MGLAECGLSQSAWAHGEPRRTGFPTRFCQPAGLGVALTSRSTSMIRLSKPAGIGVAYRCSREPRSPSGQENPLFIQSGVYARSSLATALDARALRTVHRTPKKMRRSVRSA